MDWLIRRAGMNPLFDRLSLQGQLRRIVEQYGAEQGWQIIQLALERELQYGAILEAARAEKTPH